MAVSRSRVAVAVVVATLLGVAVYVLSTAGVRALSSSEVSATTAAGSVPEFVYNPPDTVPTTRTYGPVGPVSMVFAGEHVRVGLTGSMGKPWIAVSSQDGRYRALFAPHRPAPASGAMAVSPDGRHVAWGYEDGVVLYDPVTDTSRETGPDLGPDPQVVRFSPDGRLLTVYDGSLRVVEVRTGAVLATLDGVDRRAGRQAVWTPDGSALTYVEKGRLVIHAWRSDARVSSRTPIASDARLAWQPSGKQLAVLRDTRGVKTVEVFDVVGEGRLRHARSVSRDRYAIQDLLGFTNDNRVAVTALSMDSGPLPLVYTMSTNDTAEPTEVMQLSGSGRWSTLEIATQPLASGAAPFKEPDWPVSDLSKLVASAVAALFVLGLYLTRKPRRKVSA